MDDFGHICLDKVTDKVMALGDMFGVLGNSRSNSEVNCRHIVFVDNHGARLGEAKLFEEVAKREGFLDSLREGNIFCFHATGGDAVFLSG
jgi:hypothetical protein